MYHAIATAGSLIEAGDFVLNSDRFIVSLPWSYCVNNSKNHLF